MHSVFKPKHQKLILQCYPSPKLSIAETKPNQAELSYLIFYASSRRTKLEKVGNFLLQKTRSDISHKRVGHLKVTLYILQELIVKCSEDLGFMTPYVVSITSDIIDLRDLSTSQLANEVFITYCEYLQPIQKQVFSSDTNLMKKFSNLIQKFLNFADFKSTDWLFIALSTALAFADRIDGSYPQLGNDELNKTAIYLILDTLNLNQTDLTLVKLSTSTSTTNNVPEKIGAEVEDLAIRSLKSFFDTTSKRQVDESTKNVISYLVKKKDLRWANNILIICTKNTHIEMRHRIMVQILQEVEKQVKIDDVQTINFLIKVASNILSSHLIHFVGLPVLEILNKLISFEGAMIEHNETHILKDTHAELVRNLANRVYYNNQINDMIKTVFSQYYFECTKNTRLLSDEQFLLFSEVLADNIRDILNMGEKPGITLKRSLFPVSVFNYLYSVFSFENFPKCQQKLQNLWLTLISEFYRDHATDQSTPNYEQCITNESENGLCYFFDTISQILNSENLKPELVAQIAVTIASMVSAFKINFIINYLKFASKWLENPQKLHYFLSLLILGLSASHIGEDAKPLAELADAKIAYSQSQNCWPEYISYQPRSAPSEGVLTHSELESVIKQIKPIAQWVDKIDSSHFLSSSILRQPPKRRNSMILMSPNTSLVSFGLNGNYVANGLRNASSGCDSASATSSNHLEASSTTDIDSRFFLPSHIMGNGGRSVRSGFSLRSGRFPTRVNLSDLKKTKNATITEAELSNLVKTRTAGSTLNSAPAPAPTVTGSTATTKASSGLAYSISGLDLDD